MITKLALKNKTLKYLLILPLAVVFGLALTAGTSFSHKKNSKTYVYKNAEVKVLGVSTVSKLVKINVDEIRQDYSSSNLTKNYKRLIITISLDNISDQIMQFSPGLNLVLVDKSGTTFLPTMKFHQKEDVLGGPINPSAVSRYDIDFEVPEATNLDKLIYQQDQVSEKLEIKL